MMKARTSIQSTTRNPRIAIPWPLVAAAVLYGLFAVYLYQPYFGAFTRWQWLLPANACLAALGAYVLSRRWVAGHTGALMAGAVYGFGPFLLGLAKFHPTAGLLAAGIPWLFIPAALVERRKGKSVGLPLLFVPFLLLILVSYLSAEYRLFPAPLQADVRLSDLAGFVAPLALADRSTVPLGLYHVPVAAFVLGLAMVWKARRYGILLVLTLGFLLAFSKSILGAGRVAWLGVSPILWLSIPLLWCAILSGIGLHGLIEAGFADRKWILAAAITLGVLAIVSLPLATERGQVFLGLGDGYDRLFVEAAKIYLLGAMAIGIIFIMARQNLRLHGLRWAILCIALAVDIFFGARYVVDSVL
jgi:hypothetical protein